MRPEVLAHAFDIVQRKVRECGMKLRLPIAMQGDAFTFEGKPILDVEHTARALANHVPPAQIVHYIVATASMRKGLPVDEFERVACEI